MARAVKSPIDIKVVIDTREQNVEYTKDILDKRRGSDGIKLTEIEVKTCKPNGMKVSSGDVTFEYREAESNGEWIESKFVLEIKKGTDILTTLFTKESRERFYRELDRIKEEDLDFYMISTDDCETITKAIKKIPKFRNTSTEITHFENFMNLQDKLLEMNFRGVIISGKNDLGWVVRRLIKRHVIKNKLQYLKKDVDNVK